MNSHFMNDFDIIKYTPSILTIVVKVLTLGIRIITRNELTITNTQCR